jgi:hypothetical protein
MFSCMKINEGIEAYKFLDLSAQHIKRNCSLVLLLGYKLNFVNLRLHFLLKVLDFGDFFILNVAEFYWLFDHLYDKASYMSLKSVPI